MTPDDSVEARMAAEAATLPPLEVVIPADQLLLLVGVLQLAKRHPQLPPRAREVADRVIEGARLYFADCPFVLDVIAMGEHAEFDQ